MKISKYCYKYSDIKMDVTLMLEIYYVLDIANETFDRDLIHKCINVFVNSKLNNYNLVHCQEIQQESTNFTDKDIIKKGIMTLDEMVIKLKLKTTNNVWLVYISNGDIENIAKGVGLVLVCKDPQVRECMYSINKKTFMIYTNMTKQQKLDNLKVFTKSFEEACFTSKIIKYPVRKNND